MKEVREKLAVQNLADEDKKRYDKFLDNLHWGASVAETAKIEEAERLQDQLRKQKIEIALKLVQMDFDNRQVIMATGLSEEEMEALSKNASMT